MARRVANLETLSAMLPWMEKQEDSGRAYVKELLWAALMINVIMGLVGSLVGFHLGSLWLGLGLFLGGGLVVTTILALLVLGNFGVVWLRNRRPERKRLGKPDREQGG